MSFRRIDYNKVHNPHWINQFKASIKGLGEMGPEDTANGNRDFLVPRMIWVFRAGPRPRTHVKTLLNRRTARSFDQVLSDLAEQVYEAGPIKSIYSTSGKQVLNCFSQRSIVG